MALGAGSFNTTFVFKGFMARKNMRKIDRSDGDYQIRKPGGAYKCPFRP